MSERGREIEGFFWLLVRLCSLVFGYLMIAGGALFALVVLVEQARTGAVTLNGAVYQDAVTRLWMPAIGLLVLLVGALVVKIARKERARG